MASAFRDTPIWVFLRWALGASLLRYPEEEDDALIRIQAAMEKWGHHSVDANIDVEREGTCQNAREKSCESNTDHGVCNPETDCPTPHPLIIVDWYDEKDPANPINWSGRKKSVVYLIVNFTACVVYMASAIYTPSQPLVQEVFGVSVIVASQGLGLFIVGYGVGPLIWSPLSEMPAVGRNLPYLVPLLTFVVLSVPTALANSIGSLLVLRFLQGFFGSPVLSTGGASLSDIVDVYKRPYSLYTWAIFSFAGPSIGSVIAGFTVPKLGWRWSLWEILFTTSPALILQVYHPSSTICVPEPNKIHSFFCPRPHPVPSSTTEPSEFVNSRARITTGPDPRLQPPLRLSWVASTEPSSHHGRSIYSTRPFYLLASTRVLFMQSSTPFSSFSHWCTAIYTA
jgi:DHA1 family multidrug resistance protein-like MFS transporter